MEIETPTRQQEVRGAMAVVAGLCDHGVPVRDIVVVARDLDRYEDLLARAAIRLGVTPAFWTQINLVETEPYRLLTALCEVFAATDVDRAALLRPPGLGWTPPETTNDWPLSTEILAETRHRLPEDTRSVETWHSLLTEAAWPDPRVLEYLKWAARDPEPTPVAVGEILAETIDAYRDTVLPARQAKDSPALLKTETTARAIVRLETLVTQVAHKYDQRLTEGWTDESWAAVQGMCESLARQRPGRREHANAHAVDILEANDVWAREIPYVVAIGLVDDVWPTRVRSAVPPELRDVILAGDGPTEGLIPQTAWLDGREIDQFCDTVAAATQGLIVTRHTRTVDGEPRFRSPLLEHLDVEPIGRDAREHLLSGDRTLPTQITAMCSEKTASQPEAPDE